MHLCLISPMPYAISPSIQWFVSPPTLVFFMFNAPFLVSLLYIWGIYSQVPVLFNAAFFVSLFTKVSHPNKQIEK